MLHMFSDESKARGYITAAVVVPAGAVARVRATCSNWAMPGSRRFHAQKESTARRRLALASLASSVGAVQVVIERDESVLGADRHLLSAARAGEYRAWIEPLVAARIRV